jgi:DNA repair protein RecO
MEIKQDLAIVLRSVFYEERHRIVTALTEKHGLISAMAKNSVQSKRFGGTLDLFAASLWSFSEKPSSQLVFLQEAEIKRPYEGLRKNFEKLSLASAFNEIILRLAPEGAPNSELFKLYSNALAVLEESEKVEDWIYFLNAFFIKILRWSGHPPRLSHCLECEAELESVLKQSEELTCSIADAGWVCENCRLSAGFQGLKLRLSTVALLDFVILLQVPFRQVRATVQGTVQHHEELFKFVEALVRYHLPGFDRQPIQSLKFLGLKN